MGNHESLMAQNGFYSQLYNSQFAWGSGGSIEGRLQKLLDLKSTSTSIIKSGAALMQRILRGNPSETSERRACHEQNLICGMGNREKESADMVYKEFQDLKLSALGMGAMRLPVTEGDDSVIDEAATAEMVAYAMEKGNQLF